MQGGNCCCSIAGGRGAQNTPSGFASFLAGLTSKLCFLKAILRVFVALGKREAGGAWCWPMGSCFGTGFGGSRLWRGVRRVGVGVRCPGAGMGAAPPFCWEGFGKGRSVAASSRSAGLGCRGSRSARGVIMWLYAQMAGLKF